MKMKRILVAGCTLVVTLLGDVDGGETKKVTRQNATNGYTWFRGGSGNKGRSSGNSGAGPSTPYGGSHHGSPPGVTPSPSSTYTSLPPPSRQGLKSYHPSCTFFT
ncbi:hypothetical protein FACS189449_12730 [Alphaproteobacteria bacterium]|nr:hypothetical protein FACS189449_12730 [Alphaproteobacteria bacterium]